MLVWEVVCALTAFVLMIYKCRHSQKKKYLPLFGIGAAVLYAVLFISGVAWVQEIGGDITAVLCLLFVGILESCVRCGLIQTNTGYDQLFEVCTLGAQITDQNYNVCYASANAMPLSKKMMKDAVEKDVVIDKKTRIQNRTIRGGHVLWQEDMEDIIKLLERMEENRKTIEESNCIEQENYQTKAAINMLREKNRLFDKLQTQTAKQINLLNELLNRYEEEEELEKSRSLLVKISLIGTYIKRRGNLEFIEERSKVSDVVELEACIEDENSGIHEIADPAGDFTMQVEAEDFCQRFKATLSDKDMEILELRVEGQTYEEIADRLGYKNHSGVVKRMEAIKKRFIQYEKDTGR